MTRLTLRSQALIIEALRTELAQAQATITALKGKAPSVRPTPDRSEHWTKRPVFYVAFDKDHGFLARAAAAKKLARTVALAPIATPRGTCYALY